MENQITELCSYINDEFSNNEYPLKCRISEYEIATLVVTFEKDSHSVQLVKLTRDKDEHWLVNTENDRLYVDHLMTILKALEAAKLKANQIDNVEE